jgi:hypothetical protein
VCVSRTARQLTSARLAASLVRCSTALEQYAFTHDAGSRRLDTADDSCSDTNTVRLAHSTAADFEATLFRSRVYSRAGMRCATPATRSLHTPWSQLSDVASSGASILSVLVPTLPDGCHRLGGDGDDAFAFAFSRASSGSSSGCGSPRRADLPSSNDSSDDDDAAAAAVENHYVCPAVTTSTPPEIRAWAATNAIDFVGGDSHDTNVAEKLLVRLAHARVFLLSLSLCLISLVRSITSGTGLGGG